MLTRTRYATAVLGIGLIYASLTPATFAQGTQERMALAKALTGAKVSLEQGVRATEASGRPISAKFELDKGKLQLSVYTMKGTGFSEVVVDPSTGVVSETTPITEGEDLAAAKAQSAAMAKATRSIADALTMALKANAGARAVSVVAKAASGHPVATISLVTGQTFKTVTQALD